MRSLLKYDESSPSGLRWLVDMNGGACAGDIAGSLHPDGYWLITIRERRFMAHRVIMHLVKGFDLESMLQVDHIDRNRSNNLIRNLRIVSALQNCQNKGEYKNNTSGVKGVVLRGNAWRAFISFNNKRTWLGTYQTLLDAVCARKSAELSLQRI